MSSPTCPYCKDAPTPPPEQFYETKLFRVMIARRALVDGHVVIMPKTHDPHFYGFTVDHLEEFGYLIKKVSFWAMRMTKAPSFTIAFSDGTPEVSQYNHLQIHVMPRHTQEPGFTEIAQAISTVVVQLDDDTVAQQVTALQQLMQLPQG